MQVSLVHSYLQGYFLTVVKCFKMSFKIIKILEEQKRLNNLRNGAIIV